MKQIITEIQQNQMELYRKLIQKMFILILTQVKHESG